MIFYGFYDCFKAGNLEERCLKVFWCIINKGHKKYGELGIWKVADGIGVMVVTVKRKK